MQSYLNNVHIKYRNRNNGLLDCKSIREENADYFRLLVAVAEKNIRLHTIMKPKEYYYINLNSAGNSDEVFSKSSLQYGCAVVCTKAFKLGTCCRPCPSHSHTCARLFSFVGTANERVNVVFWVLKLPRCKFSRLSPFSIFTYHQ